MNTIFSKHAITLAIMFSSSAIVLGQPADQKKALEGRATAKAKLLERYDANKNGKLDEDEIAVIARKRLLVHDTNQDGRLDEAELRAMRAKSRRMPRQDALQRAMARAQALNAARVQEEEALERKKRKRDRGRGKSDASKPAASQPSNTQSGK